MKVHSLHDARRKSVDRLREEALEQVKAASLEREFDALRQDAASTARESARKREARENN